MTPSSWWSARGALEVAGNHIWQSTLFAAVVGLLTLTFRNNRAQVRYALWLAASVKFLLPFAALMVLGSQLGWRTPARHLRVQDAAVIDRLSRPFSRPEIDLAPDLPTLAVEPRTAEALPLVLVGIWFSGCALMLVGWCVRWRRVAVAVRGAREVESGRALEMLRALESIAGIKKPIRLVSSTESFEPGVFGIVEPVLLWPSNINTHLGDEQVEAILAHEVSHVRRHDNLAASLHMLVEAVFWFHPLVWWLRARLVDERERASDEEVLRLGAEPQVYAETILKACRLSVESPLLCVAGVTGADLKKRIERIMKNHHAETLSPWRTLLLTCLAAVALVTPILLGVLNAPRLRAQSPQENAGGATFEVASIKPNDSGDGRVAIQLQPGGRFSATNVTLKMLIRNAYQLQDFQIIGGPSWLTSDHFDVIAKGEGDSQDAFAAQQREGPSRIQLMLRALLAERFKLAIHNETKEMPIYALVLSRSDGRLGPELHRSEIDCAAQTAASRGRGPLPPPGPPRPGERLPPCGGIRVGFGNMAVGGAPLSQVANSLSMFLGRVVVDRTGLQGTFELNLTWTPDQMPQRPPGAPDPPPIDPNGPSIYTAVQEQLGLKLDSQRGPVEVFVIDRVEHPTPN